MDVWRAIDGWGAGRMARHLEAVRRDMRGGIAGCVVELSILREAQNYSDSWLNTLKPSISGRNLLILVSNGDGDGQGLARVRAHSVCGSCHYEQPLLPFSFLFFIVSSDKSLNMIITVCNN